jgi:uncharacterized protein
MAILGWTRAESPFHRGELAIQARMGVREQMDQQGRQVIREFLPPQHRQFFAQLSYVMVGTVDATGNPWASILVGNPGFLSSPDDRTLHVAATPLFGDPIAMILTDKIDIGLLGIELQTRHDGFEIQVRQCFGNCPKYIQVRKSKLAEFDPAEPKPIHFIERLGEPEQTIIATSDTFFITTAYQAESAGATSGVDVSHRGGKPGFVRIDGERTLTIPDFSGNHHFNTFGNLELNPRAGLLFMDFNQGDLLYLTGQAEVVWEGAEISAYEGAERLLRFHLHRGYRVQGSLPLRWSAPEFSPFLDPMGSW